MEKAFKYKNDLKVAFIRSVGLGFANKEPIQEKAPSNRRSGSSPFELGLKTLSFLAQPQA
jgi:hypothetical protein